MEDSSNTEKEESSMSDSDQWDSEEIDSGESMQKDRTYEPDDDESVTSFESEDGKVCLLLTPA